MAQWATGAARAAVRTALVLSGCNLATHATQPTVSGPRPPGGQGGGPTLPDLGDADADGDTDADADGDADTDGDTAEAPDPPTADTAAPPDTARPACGPGGGPILSEVAEHSLVKFVEVTNAGDVDVDLGAYALHGFYNGSSSPQIVALDARTLAPCEVFVVAHDAAELRAAYGVDPDQEDLGVAINGNDAIALVRTTSGAVVDLFGEIGVDGTGRAWDYEDRAFGRAAGARAGVAVWEGSEWHDVGWESASPGAPTP